MLLYKLPNTVRLGKIIKSDLRQGGFIWWSASLPCTGVHARSQGGAGGAMLPPNLPKGPLLATKWAKNGVFVGG